MAGWEFVFQIGMPALLIALGFAAGRWQERRHFSLLAARESQLADIKVTNLKQEPDPDTVRQAAFVSGDAVIATDYFKSFAAKLRNLIGGEVKAFETLMERARREACVRMLEQARALGASEVWNVRLETSNIRSGQRNRPWVSVECFAFGTAVVRG